mmetsp:Transcript_8242/g.10793  ORF Transcript_8242/g.10793 Transcript_8242/m.10793 type:complete len:227 (-) Transcript_8242:108-788(-)|eukprot:CAMPEP_0198153106 /NCGR_PEP_ID=MMETSP1443-20131203/62696_1 /TAXON_ID=186043 /ORGANISM="Entomoneis sp., Strain CCMP2396" /LENGTH=226 /DNA_ID=CAMNT_0043819325 /DNA_START=10 /DNA_END=690 /DNA_ORIENTATION=+
MFTCAILASLNNEAVVSLLNGDASGAACQLKTLLKDFQQGNVSQNTCMIPDNPIAASVGLVAMPEEIDCIKYDETFLGLYPRAFVLDYQQREFDFLGSDAETGFATSVIMFNFALALQLSADMQAKRSYLLAMASNVYRTCIAGITCTQVTRPGDGLQLLRLAAAANLGSIFSHYQRRHEAEACYSMLPRRSTVSSPTMPCSEELRQFVLIYWTTKLYNWNVAPAA